MKYVDGFVVAVPAAQKQAYLELAAFSSVVSARYWTREVRGRIIAFVSAVRAEVVQILGRARFVSARVERDGRLGRHGCGVEVRAAAQDQERSLNFVRVRFHAPTLCNRRACTGIAGGGRPVHVISRT
jgi:Protein of unknown function (DUF1428)